MKKFLRVTLVAPIAGLLLTIAPSAQAASGWQDVAWRDMQRLAPSGSTNLGRVYTLQQIQKECSFLSSGIPATTLIDTAITVATRTSANKQQQSDMIAYGISLDLVAAKRLCPRYLPQVWAAINR